MSSRSIARISFLLTPVFLTLIKIASFFKVSAILGSYTASFSASSCMTSLVGTYGGLIGSSSVLLAGLAMRSYIGTLSVKILAYHIPGFFASASWARPHWLLRVALPIVCMIAFVSHPVGMYAAPYTLYWLIPIYFHYTESQNIFCTALSSTFVAHAVGSVIWLYAVPMTATMWLTLIPVVAVERLLIAGGMVAVYSVARVIVSFIKRIVRTVAAVSFAQ